MTLKGKVCFVSKGLRHKDKFRVYWTARSGTALCKASTLFLGFETLMLGDTSAVWKDQATGADKICPQDLRDEKQVKVVSSTTPASLGHNNQKTSCLVNLSKDSGRESGVLRRLQ
ncbi:hypothetical protein RRG08_048379 [Elysia crispata]|uniref:Uncharacterized protein n=1 Tax=Elysia crispata TaxID=231223 RepID=A0AAE1BAT3_9GAST|nr:hypothetical protein RRG08_048379 [Elysia crispata]